MVTGPEPITTESTGRDLNQVNDTHTPWPDGSWADALGRKERAELARVLARYAHRFDAAGHHAATSEMRDLRLDVTERATWPPPADGPGSVEAAHPGWHIWFDQGGHPWATSVRIGCPEGGVTVDAPSVDLIEAAIVKAERQYGQRQGCAA